MTKQDRVGVTLRKIDYLWSKKGKTFCQVIKEITSGNLELSDDEILDKIKDVFPNEKEK